MKLSHKITYKFLKTLSFCLRTSPQWSRNLFSYIFFLILYYLVPIRKKLVLQNIKSAFPNKTNNWHISTAKRSYRFFINNFIQFFAFPKSFLKSKIIVKEQNLLDNTLKKEKGIILVSGHFGAWEILSAWLGTNNYPTTGVAMKQKNRGGDKYFLEQRAQFGMKHIYRKSSFDNMNKILGQKEILILKLELS